MHQFCSILESALSHWEDSYTYVMGKIVKSLKKSIYFVDGNDLTIEMLFTLLAWLVNSVTEEYSFIGITVTNIFKRNCINFLFAPVINYHKDSDFKLRMYYLTILVVNGLKQVSLGENHDVNRAFFSGSFKEEYIYLSFLASRSYPHFLACSPLSSSKSAMTDHIFHIASLWHSSASIFQI